jgi:hypothetical protein
MKRVGLFVALAMAGFAAVAACGGKKSSNGGPCAFVSAGVGATAQFHADSTCETNPFPSDVLRTGSTVTIPVERLAYVMPKTATFAAARTYLQNTIGTIGNDGFSTLAPIVIPMSHEVDPATVPTGIALFIFDSAGNPTKDTSHTFEGAWDPLLQALTLQAQTPFDEKTTYGIVVTANLLDNVGLPTNRAPEFERYLISTTTPPPADITALMAAAGTSGITPDTIALGFTFHTSTVSAGLVAIRNQIFAAGVVGSSLAPQFLYPSDQQLPGLIEGVWAAGSQEFIDTLAPDTQPNLGFLATGTFDVYKFRDDKELPFVASYLTDATSSPTEHVDFRVALPVGVPPAGGWPVILYQHGLGGSSFDVFHIGNLAAPSGFATIGMSAVAHGRRGGVFEIFNWDNMASTRDNFRESVADDLQLLRMMRNGHAAGVAPFNQMNTDDVSFMGISLGGILGGTFMALAPNVTDGALIVPGGHLSFELEAPGVGQAYLYQYISSRAGLDPVNAPADFQIFLKPFEILVQTGLDPADPVNYGKHVVTPGQQLGVEAKRILIQESKGDTWVPNTANEALRRAIGIPIFTTPQSDVVNGVSGAWVISSAQFPSLSGEPHSYWGKLCNEQRQTFTWLASNGTIVIDPATVTCP